MIGRWMGIFRRKCPVWNCPLSADSFGGLLSFGKRAFLFASYICPAYDLPDPPWSRKEVLHVQSASHRGGRSQQRRSAAVSTAAGSGKPSVRSPGRPCPSAGGAAGKVGTDLSQTGQDAHPGGAGPRPPYRAHRNLRLPSQRPSPAGAGALPQAGAPGSHRKRWKRKKTGQRICST